MGPKLNYKIVGNGEPVIILHGLFGMMDNWLTLAKKLETEGYMTYLIDQRDHGRSEHTETFNYKLLADDLYQFIEENKIHDSILIGHSMGGKTCLKFVSEYKGKVSKLIIIDIGTKQYPVGHDQVFKALFAINPGKLQSRNEAEVILMSHLNDHGTVQFLMKNLTRNKEGGFEWKMNLSLLYKDYSNILEEIEFKKTCYTNTMFVRGSKSDYIKDEDLANLKEKFPNSKIVTVEHAGHWVHADRPNELFQEINTFIRE